MIKVEVDKVALGTSVVNEDVALVLNETVEDDDRGERGSKYERRRDLMLSDSLICAVQISRIRGLSVVSFSGDVLKPRLDGIEKDSSLSFVCFSGSDAGA